MKTKTIRQGQDYANSQSHLTEYQKTLIRTSFIDGYTACAKDMERDRLSKDTEIIDRLKSILQPQHGNNNYTWAQIVEAIMLQADNGEGK